MSILACLPRLKALFARALRRRAALPDAATRNWRRSDFRPRRHRSRQRPRIANARCHDEWNNGEEEQHGRARWRGVSAGSRCRDRALGRLAAVNAAPGRPLGFRARSRRDDPGRIHPAAALSRHDRRGGLQALEQRIARYLREVQGEDGGWPLFHGGALDISASVKAYFALKAAGDPVDAPHMARARAADPGARRRAPVERVHADHAGAVGRGAVARGAGHAGRDHAAARLVSVSHRQGVVLVAHRAGAAAGADGAAPDRPQPARRHDRRVVHRAAGRGAGLDFAADADRDRPCLHAARPAAAAGRADVPGRSRGGARSTGPWLLSPSGSTARTGSAASSRRWPTR